MRPREIVRALDRAFEAKLPTMLWGQPGIGKSSMVAQFAKERKICMIDQRISQMDPVDLRGIPFRESDRTHWCVPEFLPDEKRDGKEGVLLLDEINTGAQSVQAAAYQLIQDRRLGNYVLPKGWLCLAAGNNETDRAIVNKMSTALRNRFMHIDVEVNVDDWRAWAARNQIRDEVRGFLAFRPSDLNTFGKDTAKDDKAFATPRSWEFVSRIMPDEDSKTSIEEEFALYVGCVGIQPATNLVAYLKYHRNLPDLDGVIMRPDSAKVPKEPAQLWAIVTSLAARATKDNLDQICTYFDRLDQEYQVLGIKDAIVRDETLCETKAFQKWSVKNGKLMT